MITLRLSLMILAVCCFFIAAVWSRIETASPPYVQPRLVAGGLCLWALATIVSV